MLKVLHPLVMMQLKDKIDFGWLKSNKLTITKILLSILAFVLITTVVYLLFWFAKFLKIFHLIGIIPINLMVLIFTIMEVLIIVSCTWGIMKALYFSKDNTFLLTLPVTNNQLFLSKITVYLIYELKRTLYFLVPLFLAYGIISNLPIYFYFWLIFCWIIISVFNVSLSSLLSIPTMAITNFLKNFNVLKIILFLIVLGLGIWGVVSIINLIPEDLDIVASWGTIFWDIQNFLNAFALKVLPLTYLTRLIIGGYIGIKPQLFSTQTIIILLVLIGIIVSLLILTTLITRPLFFRLASKPFEYRKNTKNINGKNKKSNPYLSAVKTQTLLILRNSDDLFPLLFCAISMPILILLLNKVYASMSTRLLGDHMTVAFNMLIILLISMASSSRISSVYSREGSSAYLNKTRPNEYSTNLFAKITPNAVVMILSIIATVSVFSSFANLGQTNKICFSLTAIFIYLMHLLWSAELDIMNPQSSVYAMVGEHSNNPNETKSSVIMFVFSIIIVGIAIFLSIENISIAWIKIVVLSLLLFAFRLWSYLTKIKYYYKEK